MTAAPALSRSFQPSTLRGVNRDARTVDIVASDFSLDSYNTRIDPAGWDLEQFKRNPVICLQHDSYSALPVAQALPETVRVENGKLLMTVQFPPEGTSEDADEAFNLIAAGVLRGVSVGFAPDPSSVESTTETVDGSNVSVMIFHKQRLMEVSFVTIPSNDNGLVIRARELNADPEALKAQVRRLENQLGEHAKEAEAREKIAAYTATHLLECVGYRERKQPANKVSTKVLEKFFKARGEEQPADEVAAWTRMAELVEAETLNGTAEATVTVPTEPLAPVTTEKHEEPAPAAAPNPEPTTPPAPAAPEPERAALVHVPLSVLADLPRVMARALAEPAVAALREGMPLPDALGLIDGLQAAVIPSISSLVNGNAH